MTGGLNSSSSGSTAGLNPWPTNQRSRSKMQDHEASACHDACLRPIRLPGRAGASASWAHQPQERQPGQQSHEAEAGDAHRLVAPAIAPSAKPALARSAQKPQCHDLVAQRNERSRQIRRSASDEEQSSHACQRCEDSQPGDGATQGAACGQPGESSQSSPKPASAAMQKRVGEHPAERGVKLAVAGQAVVQDGIQRRAEREQQRQHGQDGKEPDCVGRSDRGELGKLERRRERVLDSAAAPAASATAMLVRIARHNAGQHAPGASSSVTIPR